MDNTLYHGVLVLLLHIWWGSIWGDRFLQGCIWSKKLGVVVLPDGKILHARLKIGDSVLMMSDQFPGNTASKSQRLLCL